MVSENEFTCCCDVKGDEEKNLDPTDELEERLKHIDKQTYEKLVKCRKECAEKKYKLEKRFDWKECEKQTRAAHETIQSEKNTEFSNYGRTVQAVPEYMFYPKSLDDLQAIVRNAAKNRKRVRAVGAGHSWSPIFSETHHWLISTQYLSGIKNIKLGKTEEGRQIVTMLSGTPVHEFTDFCKANDVCIPLDVILDSVTYGGTVLTGSHGGGWERQTLADLVHSMNIVCGDGEVRTFGPKDGKRVMSAVNLNLGLFGVVYSLALYVIPMFNAKVVNKTYGLEELLPRKGDDFSLMEKICEDNFYNEFFWFPWTEEFHVMTFNKTEDPITHDESPSFGDLWTKVTTLGGNFLLDALFDHDGSHFLQHSGLEGPVNEWFGKILSSAMSDGSHVLKAPNALHWRKYIPLTKVGDLEFGIPVDSSSDFAVIRDCFYEVVDRMEKYKEKGEYPLNMAIEFRFIAGSDALLSPARGNSHTCYIEILSGTETPGFLDFGAEIAQAWIKLSPNAKPHWAKWYQGIPDIVPRLQNLYKDEMKEFSAIRKELAVDPNNMFSNSFLDSLFGFETPPTAVGKDENNDGVADEFQIDPAKETDRDTGCCQGACVVL